MEPVWIPFFCSQHTLSLSRQCTIQALTLNNTFTLHLLPTVCFGHMSVNVLLLILICSCECAAPIPTMSPISLKLKTTSITIVYKIHYLDPNYLYKHKFCFLFFVHSVFTTFDYLLLLKNASPGVMFAKR